MVEARCCALQVNMFLKISGGGYCPVDPLFAALGQRPTGVFGGLQTSGVKIIFFPTRKHQTKLMWPLSEHHLDACIMLSAFGVMIFCKSKLLECVILFKIGLSFY